VWEKLYTEIKAEADAQKSGAADVAERSARVEQLLLRQAGGNARVHVGFAVEKTYGKVFEEQAAAERLVAQLAAYKAAPEVFMLRSYLRMLTEGLRTVTKYVIAVNDPTKVRLNLDMKPKQALDVLGAELSAGDKQNAGK